ncbi:MAG: hypothetical protein L6R48_24010, partial [Planctomycetes bacterium]|nr:hypothetical protein [Planctomycetota bacterium]
MDGHAARSARERLELADRRLVALQESGIDTGSLVTRLRVARVALSTGQVAEAEAACEEILATIRRLADGGDPGQSHAEDRRRHSSDRLRAIPEPGLTQEVVAKAITIGELERRVTETAARISDQHAQRLEEKVAGAIAAVTEATSNLAGFRSELEGTVRALVAESAAQQNGAGQMQDEQTARLAETVEQAVRLAQAAEQRAAAADGQAQAALQAITTVGEDMGRYHGQLDSVLQAWFADADQRNAAAQAQAEAAQRRAEEVAARAAATAEALERATAEMAGLRTSIEGNLRVPAEASRRAEQASNRAAELATKAEARAEAAEASAAANAEAFTELRSTLETSLRALVDEAAERTVAVLAEAKSQESAVRTAAGSHELNELIASVGEQAAAAGEQAKAAAEAARAATAAAEQAAANAITREDLDRLGESLRKDLDWQVEKVAAERGWCTMADVDAALVRSADAGADSQQAKAVTSRLERALAGFVTQSQQQQQRLMDLLQNRLAGGPAASPGSGALSRGAPAGAGEAPRPRKRETEQLIPLDESSPPGGEADLDVLSRSSQYRALKNDRVGEGEAQPSSAPESPSDDEAPTRKLTDPAAPELNPTTRMVLKDAGQAAAAKADEPAQAQGQEAQEPAADDHSSDLHPATVRLGAQHLSATDPDRLVAAVAAEIAAKGGTSKIVRSGELPVIPPTSAPVAGSSSRAQPATRATTPGTGPISGARPASSGAGDISALLARAEAALAERADQAGTDMRAAAAAAAPAAKILRIASASETGFDPARVGDVPSFLVLSHIFEPLLGYDPLARPV